MWVVGIAGSPFPPGQLSMAGGKTEKGVLRISTLKKPASVGEALADLPPLLPPGAGLITILTEVSDYIGGPVIASQAMELASQPTLYQGQSRRRSWTVVPVQAAPGDRIGDGAEWKADVPRRAVLAALVSAGFTGRVKVDATLPLAESFREGVTSLRQKKSLNEEQLNPSEDLALAVALCAWWVSVSRDT